MQTAVLVLLFGGFLSGLHAEGDQDTPDLLSMVTKLQSQVQSLQSQVQSLESSQAQLQRGSPVAFYAAFFTDSEEGNHGPFNIATTIKYKQVITNVGNGYNAATGAFTATVKGLYVFHFTMFGSFNPTPNAVASLRKNGVKLAYALDQSSSDSHDSSTRVAVVTLEAGDSVYVELQAQSYFYDYHGDHNSFSGFLLFRM
uniref:C1q domain-containing protein n=1 Tax=Neogobius melanostomus TaxID=47308 RepID=A0A8C6WYL8_9GOBI